MITLHIEADNYADLQLQLRGILNGEGRSTQPAAAANEASETTADIDADRAEPAKPKKTTRKKAAETAPEKPEGDAPAFLEEPKAKSAQEVLPPECSLEDMRTAMNDLAKAKGMPAVADLLKTFKKADGSVCQKASEVQPDDRAVMAAKCAELAA